MKPALPVLVALALLPLVAGSPAHAQTPERHLYVSVLDSDGFPIQGLTARAFLVREDGNDREVLRAGPATDPMQVDILVDTSAAARQIIGDIRRAVEGFVETLDGHQLSLIAFGGTRFVIVESTADLERVTSGIPKLFSRPDTATYLVNSLDDTARGFERREAPRPVSISVPGPSAGRDTTPADRRRGPRRGHADIPDDFSGDVWTGAVSLVGESRAGSDAGYRTRADRRAQNRPLDHQWATGGAVTSRP